VLELVLSSVEGKSMLDSGSSLLSPDELSQRKARLGAMRLSLIEGSFAMVMVAMLEAFYVPYFNAMGAGTLQIGLAASLPALAASLIYIYSPMALRRAGSHRKLVVLTVLLQAAGFIPFALVSHLHGKSWAVWGAIGFYVLLSSAGNLGAASWADWMGSIVPKKWHGKYFANRNRLLSLIQIAIVVFAGFLLDRAAGKVMLMFSLIWLSCFLARSISGLFLMLMYEPPPVVRLPVPSAVEGSRPLSAKKHKQTGGFLAFIKALPQTNFGTFTLATSLLSLAANFSAPFFAVHMLRNLKLSYVEYTVLTVTATAATVGFLGLWGRIIDRLGAIVPIRFCALGITLLPLPWVITENYWLLMCVQVLAGFCWAGFNLGVFVYYLNYQGHTMRVSSISYFNAINFFCVFVGSTLGGLLGPYLPTVAKYQLQTIFIVSVLIRIAPAILFRKVIMEKQPQKFTVIERLFFNPKFNIFPGITRSIFRFFKRDI
jgi:MFS family permease